MNARDLPGYGDAATFSPAALASLRMLDEMDADDQRTANDIEQARAELADWVDTFNSASRRGDVGRMRQARDMAVSIMASLAGIAA